MVSADVPHAFPDVPPGPLRAREFLRHVASAGLISNEIAAEALALPDPSAAWDVLGGALVAAAYCHLFDHNHHAANCAAAEYGSIVAGEFMAHYHGITAIIECASVAARAGHLAYIVHFITAETLAAANATPSNVLQEAARAGNVPIVTHCLAVAEFSPVQLGFALGNAGLNGHAAAVALVLAAGAFEIDDEVLQKIEQAGYNELADEIRQAM